MKKDRDGANKEMSNGAVNWVCPNTKCLNLNPSRYKRCSSCGTSSNFKQTNVSLVAPIGKNLAEKSGGLFSEEDWECPKCKNINWAKRFYCNVCKAARFKSTETRTGYGGGFKENEDIEYIQRDDINNEIDDFGRRRGKIKDMLNMNQSINNNTYLNDSEDKLKSSKNYSDDASSYSDSYTNSDEESSYSSSNDKPRNRRDKHSLSSDSDQSTDEDEVRSSEDEDDDDDDLSKYNLDSSDDNYNLKNNSTDKNESINVNKDKISPVNDNTNKNILSEDSVKTNRKRYNASEINSETPKTNSNEKNNTS